MSCIRSYEFLFEILQRRENVNFLINIFKEHKKHFVQQLE